MGRAHILCIVAACLVATAAIPAAAQTYVETGKEFRQGDRVTMGGDLLTNAERQRFAERRKAAGKNRSELDRIEAEERALLNQRVAERIAGALNPANVGGSSTTERPAQ